MIKEQIKLELIKLTHRFDRHPDECLKDAEIYEKYVFGLEDKVEEKSSDKKAKKN